MLIVLPESQPWVDIKVNDKSELLQQLKIDRDQPVKNDSGGIKLAPLVLIGLVIAALAYGGYWVGTQYGNKVQDSKQGHSQTGAETGRNSGEAAIETAIPEPQPKLAIEQDNTVLSASGYITARRMATVSAEIMGLITEVNVEEGMQVQQGQVLAQLDSALATVNYELAKARVRSLEASRDALLANLEEAKRNHSRITNNEFSSEAQRSAALAQMQSLSASLESARADIVVAQWEAKRQQERLNDHTIRAPFAGVVTVKNAQPGEIVAPTSAGGGFTRTGICTIVDMESLEIEVDVNESFIGRVFPGQQVEALLDAYPDWTIPASVIAIIPTADRGKATVQVRIKLELKDPKILPDMGVKVNFLKA